jgi:hypothetical protein
MRALRPVLTCLALLLAACGRDECSQPRTGDEETCDTYDGGQLSFVLGDPLPDVSAYCESRCVDVNAPIAIGGYADLRDVPFLPKVRRVKSLGLNMRGVSNLRGLEKVDVIGQLRLFGIEGQVDSSRKTLEGLLDEEVEGFDIERVSGLDNLDGLSVRRATVFSLMSTSLQQIDLSSVDASFVSVHGNSALKSLALSSNVMKRMYVRGNRSLSELSWISGLQVRDELHFENNAALSSCLVQRFADETDAGTIRREFNSGNGPCP